MGRRQHVLLLTLLLATALLAGCIGLGDGDGGGDGDGRELTEAEARQRYQSAMTSLQDPAAGVEETFDRVSTEMTVEAANASEGSGTMHLLLDRVAHVAVFEVSGELFQDGGSGSPGGFGGDVGAFLFAQVHRTSFFGTPEGLIGIYNGSQEPVTGWDDVDTSPTSSDDEGGLGFTDPSNLLGELDDLQEDATVTYERTTYEGKDAIEVTVTYDEPVNGTEEVRAILWLDPDRPALVEASFRDPDAEDPVERDGTVRMTFQYGDDATHPREEGLVRLESMTFLSSDAAAGGFGDGGRETNYTIQPSANPGLVPLTEVTLRVTNGSAPDQDVVLTLPLEEGSAEHEDVRVTFEDVDGDGHVSPGDRILLETLDERYSFSPGLEDEVTGLVLVPGPGVPLAALALLGAALVVGRRRVR